MTETAEKPYPLATSFPGSLILPSPGASEGGGKMRDTGNEVDPLGPHIPPVV